LPCFNSKFTDTIKTINAVVDYTHHSETVVVVANIPQIVEENEDRTAT
jgi:hypothetical protein